MKACESGRSKLQFYNQTPGKCLALFSPICQPGRHLLPFWLKTNHLKTGTAIILGLAGLAVFELWRKQSALGSLNFYPAGIKKLDFDGATPVITVTLVAQNTSNKTFTLNSIAGNLFADEFFVGNLSGFNNPVQIASNAQTGIDLDIRLQIIGIANNIIKALTQNDFSVNLELDAWANIDSLQVPINQKFKIGA